MQGSREGHFQVTGQGPITYFSGAAWSLGPVRQSTRESGRQTASAPAWPHVSRRQDSPGRPVPAGCSAPSSPVSLRCPGPWLLLLDGPSLPRKRHGTARRVLERCLGASSKPTPQTGQNAPPQPPQDSHCSPERLPGLAYCPLQLSPGRAC